MRRKEIRYVGVCICVFVHFLGNRSEESPVIESEESSQHSYSDAIREDAEEMFYNIDLKKFDGVKCPEPEPPENGAIVGEENQVGSVVYVECKDGYKLDGSEIMGCMPVADGARWSPLVPGTCVETDKSHETHTETEMTDQGTAPQFHDKLSISSPYSPWQKIQHYRNHNLDALKEDQVPETTNLLAPLCQDKPDIGPCRAFFKRYYFSSTTMECHAFIYGGCYGNRNNFETVTDCNMACLGHE